MKRITYFVWRMRSLSLGQRIIDIVEEFGHPLPMDEKWSLDDKVYTLPDVVTLFIHRNGLIGFLKVRAELPNGTLVYEAGATRAGALVDEFHPGDWCDIVWEKGKEAKRKRRRREWAKFAPFIDGDWD